MCWKSQFSFLNGRSLLTHLSGSLSFCNITFNNHLLDFLENSNLNLSAKSNQSNSLNRSDTLLQQKSQFQENRANKTTWNQQQQQQRAASSNKPVLSSSAKSTSRSNSFNKSTHLLPLESQNVANDSTTTKKSSVPHSNSNESAATKPKSSPPSKSFSTAQSKNDPNAKNVKLDSIMQSNKIPHPPPQSTRPTSSSARKIRLSSVVKTNTTSTPQEQPTPPKTINFPPPSSFNNGDSSNEEDVHNSSSKTIFDYNANSGGASSISNLLNPITSLSHAKPPAISSNSNNNNNESNMFNESINDLVQILKSSNADTLTNFSGRPPPPHSMDASNSIAYSFSSKPKPLTVNNKDLNSTISTASTSVHKNAYDYRKYLSTDNNPTYLANKINKVRGILCCCC